MMEGVESGGGHHGIDYCDVISIENLFNAWREFARGKRSKKDVATFELNLEDNIFYLHKSLTSGAWCPDPYEDFYVHDPKLRRIHKATVRDRVLYQAVYRSLYNVFDPSFIHDVYSSRNNKGTHAGVNRLEVFTRKITRNHTQSAFVLKCDIKKFFDSVDHNILFQLLSKRILDEKLRKLIFQIIDSFHHTENKGLPLGNVTSQLFANVYLNELDQFVKHKLKEKCYIRYCDDFIVLNNSKKNLEKKTEAIRRFLATRLRLNLHPNKIMIRKLHQGVDFLGWVNFPNHRVLRTSTKRRMFKRIISTSKRPEIVQSYLGLLKHGNTWKLRNMIVGFAKFAQIKSL